MVGPLVVRVNPHNAIMDCGGALAVTNEAYVEMSLTGRVLRERWDVLYRYGFLDFVEIEFSEPALNSPVGSIPDTGFHAVMAEGMTYPELRAIVIEEHHGRDVLHELFHAWVSTRGDWGADQHKEFCRLGLDKLEHEFTGRPVRYCR